MKNLLFVLLLFTSFSLMSQDSTNVVVMSVELLEVDSLQTKKEITYTYPNGESMVRKFNAKIDTVLYLEEEEMVERMTEERLRYIDEINQRLSEINAIEVYLAQSDVKLKAYKDAKKLKYKDK